MKILKYYEDYINKVSIGIDIDGTINNFGEAYNTLYKKYFPDKLIKIFAIFYCVYIVNVGVY